MDLLGCRIPIKTSHVLYIFVVCVYSMARVQCGLCLSCGAPFLPKSKEVSFFNRRGNLSILYINNKFMESRELQNAYLDPKYSDEVHNSHIFHDSHHGPAIDYMCNHHTKDSRPEWPDPIDSAIPNLNGPLAYYTNPSGSSGAELAVWDRPPKNTRIDFSPLLEHMKSFGQSRDRDTRRRQDLTVTYPMCKACNSIMTGLAKTRYLIGFSSAANKNTRGCVIRQGSTPISCVSADPNGVTVLGQAYGQWKCRGDPASDAVRRPTRQGTEDPVSPHVAYYLHMCLPYISKNGPFRNIDPFTQGVLRGSARTARNLYIELSWIILMIGCVCSLMVDGKSYGENQSHGIQQHYGVLDIYVSYFIWRLMEFDYKERLSRVGLDFVHWHQKYFWEAINCPAFLGRGLVTVGLDACPSTETDARSIFENICRELMTLYSHKLSPLIRFVTGNLPSPMDEVHLYVSNYFVSSDALKNLKRLAGVNVSVCYFACFPTP